MKILLTGASGLLGREVKSIFEKKKSWEVLGTGFKRLDNGLRKVDLRSSAEVVELMNEIQPDVVVHLAAERNYGTIAKNENEAFQLNVKASETIARAVNDYGGYVLYISTNLVFDGTKPPYKTVDIPKPANTYGALKLEGENVVRKCCPKAGILRLPLLYGKVEHLMESGVSYLLSVLQDTSKKVIVSDYEHKYPTSTYDVAIVCKQIIEQYEEKGEFSGIYHWCGDEKLTKFDMIKTMSCAFQLPMHHIEPSLQPVGKHLPPYDCRLDCTALEQIGIGHRTPFEKLIKRYLQPYVK